MRAEGVSICLCFMNVICGKSSHFNFDIQQKLLMPLPKNSSSISAAFHSFLPPISSSRSIIKMPIQKKTNKKNNICDCFTEVPMVTSWSHLFQADTSHFSFSLCLPQWLHLPAFCWCCGTDSRVFALNNRINSRFEERKTLKSSYLYWQLKVEVLYIMCQT